MKCIDAIAKVMILVLITEPKNKQETQLKNTNYNFQTGNTILERLNNEPKYNS